MNLKVFAPKHGRGRKGDRKVKADSDNCGEDTGRSQPLARPAYYQARTRGFARGMELDDWLDAASNWQESRRAAP